MNLLKIHTAVAILGVVAAFSGLTLAIPAQSLQMLPVQMSAEDFFFQGNVRYAQGDYKGAIENFTQAIRLQPDYADAYTFRSSARLYLEEYQEALADSTQAIRLAPNSAIAYNNRCYARARGRGDYQGAIEDCNKAIQLDPNTINSAASYSSRCYVRAGMGDKTALSDCNQALKIDPNYLYSYEDQGLARSALGDKNGAIEDFQRAAKLFSDRGDIVSLQRVQELTRKLQLQELTRKLQQ